MPDKIDVQCECGRWFRVPVTYAGRAGKCSACGRRMMISAQSRSSDDAPDELQLVDERAQLRAQREQELDALREAIANDPTDAQAHMRLARMCSETGDQMGALEHYRTAYILDKSLKSALDRIEAIAGPDERERLEEPDADEARHEGRFWVLLARAFIFPFSKGGLPILILGTLCFTLVGWLLGFLVSIYLACYACDVVRHVAGGGDEPPDWPDVSDLGELFWSVFAIVVCVWVSFLPAAASVLVLDAAPAVFLALACAGLAYFPMCLLSVVILHTIWAASPHVVLPAICRTHVRYVAVVVVVFVAAGVSHVVQHTAWLPFVPRLVQLYALLVEMYALGVLYRCNDERIGWLVRRAGGKEG